MRDALVDPLLGAALRGAVVLLVALVLTVLLHRRSAALRHWILSTAIEPVQEDPSLRSLKVARA